MPGIPQKAFTFYVNAIWPIYTRRTLPGPDPVLLSSANRCVERRTPDDSIASRGKNLCFLIFNWFYRYTLLIVPGGQTRKGIKGMGGTVEDVGWDREGREMERK